MTLTERIGVFVAAGSKTPKDKELLEQGRILGEFLGKNDYTFIQGASTQGLMGATYNEFVKYSYNVILHLWEIFKDEEKYVVEGKKHKSLNLRLEGFLQDTDVLIVLPGANGTLHEFCTFFEYARYNKIRSKIILVNYKGFYDDLINQYKKQVEWGFFNLSNFKGVCHIVNNVEEAIKFIPPADSKIKATKK